MSVVSEKAGPDDTDLTPLALNSSASATPLARMRRRLKVAAALIPAGKPVEFFVSLNLFRSYEYHCRVPGLTVIIARADVPCRAVLHTKSRYSETGYFVRITHAS